MAGYHLGHDPVAFPTPPPTQDPAQDQSPDSPPSYASPSQQETTRRYNGYKNTLDLAAEARAKDEVRA